MNSVSGNGFVDVGCGMPSISAGIGLKDQNVVVSASDSENVDAGEVVGLAGWLPSD
jgi:hypothetical protein